MDKISTQVKETISRVLSVDVREVTDTAILRELGMDSLDEVDIIMRLEGCLNIIIQDGEMHQVRTVGDLLELVTSKIS